MSDIAVVIGCSSGIGRAICETLVERGDIVVGTTRSGFLQDGQEAIEGVDILPCDSTSIESIRNLFNTLSTCRPRHLVYCAGFHRLALVSPISSGSLEDHLAVNYVGAVNCARLFVGSKYSRTDVQRTITVVASIAHRVGEAGLVGYSASKAAVVAAVRGMAVEYAGKNIRVNSVSPGWIEGDRADTVSSRISGDALEEIRRRYPLGYGQPKDIGFAVSFLSSNLASWITGVDLPVDGGRTVT
jgi:NAD(P)-dependent dehydrogenase (short-subunit alcohol dehydrogenase family)